MNDPHSQSDISTPKTEGGFLFDDWNLPEEKGPTDNTTLFDGKIIARMPDLGSESIVKNVEKPKSHSFWGKMWTSGLSVMGNLRGITSANIRIWQRLFHRVTAFGVIVLLCGVGMLLINPSTDQPTENAIDIAEIVMKNTKPSATESVAVITGSSLSPVLPPEIGNGLFGIVPSSAIPVAPVENVTAISPPSPWDRPAADSYASREVTPKPSVNPHHPTGVDAVGNAPMVLSEAVVMSPMTPITTTSMPASAHEMPVSPFELQLVAQSNSPEHLPVGAQMQPGYSVAPVATQGMMPPYGQRVNMPGGAPQQNMRWNTSPPPQFPPPVHGQMTSNHPQGQFGQQNQYVVPPGYMLPQHQAVPQSTPIPSGVSTLSPQGGQYMQPHGMPVPNVQPLGTPVQRPHSDFYNAPPNYRRVY